MITRITVHLAIALDALRRRWQQLAAEPQRGSTPEQTALIALLVVMAITVVGIISAKVVSAANGISLP